VRRVSETWFVEPGFQRGQRRSWISRSDPIKDEKRQLDRLHERLSAALAPFAVVLNEIVLVDDGSADGSFALLECLAVADRA